MKARGFNHVSVYAHDLEESVHFYQTLFGLQEIPAPEFPFPVRWLRAGHLELHLFESDAPAPAGHHFGLDVDNFEPVLREGAGDRRAGRGRLLLRALRAARRGSATLPQLAI
jgi:catechol 2,3-dioxygenase-like lactoylglutathione lyase family enzyme